MRSSGLLGFLLVTMVLGSGCGDDDRPPPPPIDGGLRRDGGPADSGGIDGGTSDGAVPDGSLPRTDGGLVGCTAGPAMELFTDPSLNFPDFTVGVGTGADGFLVGWIVDGFDQNVFIRHLGATGDASAARDLSMRASVNVREPAFAGLGADGWLAIWPDNSSIPANFELYLDTLDSGGAGGGAPVRVTNDVDPVFGDVRPSLVQTGIGYLLVWTKETRAGQQQLFARTLDTSGAPTGTERRIDSTSTMFNELGLTTLSDGVALGSIEGPEVIVRALDTDGTPRGAPVAVNNTTTLAGGLDLWGSLLGGAVVYDVTIGGARKEIRFRAIDETGAPAAAERGLSEIGGQGRAPSIDYFGGTFAVAYRARSRDGADTVDVLFVDAVGNELSRLMVSPLDTWQNGDVWMRFTPEGQGLIVWTDRLGTALTLRASRLTCGGM